MSVDMDERLALALGQSLVIGGGSHPELVQAAYRRFRRGELVRLLPGIYAATDHWPARVAAAAAFDPDAVFTDATAARLSWWPQLETNQVCLATGRHSRQGGPPWLKPSRRRIDPDQVVDLHGHRLTHPALTVIDLTADPRCGASAIDEALRRGVVSLDSLDHALDTNPNRPGNSHFRRLLHESRAEPWSALERDAHQKLWRAGIKGWKTNFRVQLPQRVVYLDIALTEFLINIELDGWQFHRSEASFHADRQRDLDLTLLGWTVLRFTAHTIHLLPEVVASLIQIKTRAGARAA